MADAAITYSSEFGVLAACQNAALDIMAILYGFVLGPGVLSLVGLVKVPGLAELTDLDRRSRVGRQWA